jgi:hypothetical protein
MRTMYKITLLSPRSASFASINTDCKHISKWHCMYKMAQWNKTILKYNLLLHAQKGTKAKLSLSNHLLTLFSWCWTTHTLATRTRHQDTIHKTHISDENRKQKRRKRSAKTYSKPFYIILKFLNTFYIINFNWHQKLV